MSQDNFIRIQVVEKELVDFDAFEKEFKKRIESKQFPIRVKINEGPELDLLTVNNTNFVDYLITQTPAQNIEIETDNLLENNSKVKIIKFFNHLPFLAYQNIESTNKTFDKKVMQFVGNYRWPRFVLSQWLYENHSSDCFLTYWFTHNYLQAPPQELLKCLTQEQIAKHVNRLPLTIDTNEIKDHSGYIDWKHTNPLLPFYNKAFLDVVCETWHEGNTFMPTEKIARPLVCKNPFIVYGPVNFLQNLKKLGFKTFGDFWSEDYDTMHGKDRIEAIKPLINWITKMNTTELNDLYQKLLPTLEHNQQVYNKLSHQTITLAFKK